MSDTQDYGNQLGKTITYAPYDPTKPAFDEHGNVVLEAQVTAPQNNDAQSHIPKHAAPSPAVELPVDEGSTSGKVRGGVFTCTEGSMKGEKITIFKVNPSLVQKVIQSVKLPKRPTYETRTFSGRVEVHPMDEVVADQTPGYKGVWEQYVEDKAEAEAERNERLAAVLLSRGTRYTIKRQGWEEEHEALGIVVPKEENIKRAHFLATELDSDDLNDLVKEILRLTGITEDRIKEAEDSFRN